MVSALYLIVDNHGKPTLLGYSGEWPHANFLTGSFAVQSLLGDGGIAKQVVLKRAPSGHLNSFFLSQILLSQFVLKLWKSAFGDRLLHPNPYLLPPSRR